MKKKSKCFYLGRDNGSMGHTLYFFTQRPTLCALENEYEEYDGSSRSFERKPLKKLTGMELKEGELLKVRLVRADRCRKNVFWLKRKLGNPNWIILSATENGREVRNFCLEDFEDGTGLDLDIDESYKMKLEVVSKARPRQI
jgi:hypothetical protein